jgi:hypothetical protein
VDPGLANGDGQRAGLRGGLGHRLLGEDVLPDRRGLEQDARLGPRTGRDEHSVDPGVTQEVAVVRVAPRHTEPIREHLKLAGVAPAQPHHGDLGDLRQREEMLFRDDRARPHDAEPQGGHVGLDYPERGRLTRRPGSGRFITRVSQTS